jgi:hypothetical protein
MCKSVNLIRRLAKRSGFGDEDLKDMRFALWISIFAAVAFVSYYGMMMGDGIYFSQVSTERHTKEFYIVTMIITFFSELVIAIYLSMITHVFL